MQVFDSRKASEAGISVVNRAVEPRRMSESRLKVPSDAQQTPNSWKSRKKTSLLKFVRFIEKNQ